MRKLASYLATLTLVGFASAPALAAEQRIGERPLVENGMIISAVYLQPVHMAPELPGMQEITDVHLEADIHADKGNAQGFAPGTWIPYLTIAYQITKQGSNWGTFGHLVPMTANDGPHYGANLRLDGPGKYHLSYRLLPPPYAGFYRHTDKETGVAEWWKPFTVSWDFIYVGVGKKGGY